MFEREHSYPAALSTRDAAGVQQAIAWVVSQQRTNGGQILLYLPGKQNLRANPTIERFSRVPGVEVGTWRGGSTVSWSGGPVLATWPNREKLAEIADTHGVTALCVIPWVDAEVKAWQAATDPVLLAGAISPAPAPVLDPVVIEGLKTLTSSVNHANHLAGSLDRRDAVAVLRTLKQGGYELNPDGIYAWALANGWPGRGAERLRELAEAYEAGKRPQMKGDFPFRADILQVWRRDAEAGT